MSGPSVATDVPARAPRVVHSLPGRIRVHVPYWSGEQQGSLEQRLCELEGVTRARANGQTRNVLIHYDEGAADAHSILAALGGGEVRRAKPSKRASRAERQKGERPKEEKSPQRFRVIEVPRAAVREVGRVPKHAIREVGRLGRRARITVRGLDRDPQLARTVVERLGQLPGVSRVSASQLTGRVLVEFSERSIRIEDLLAQVTQLELPELPGEDRPSHPLDPAPVIQSTARVIGSGLGLGLFAGRRAVGRPGTQGGPGAQVAGVMGIIEGLPPIEQGLEQLLGRNGAQLAISGIAIISLTFAGNALGLAVSGAGALRLMTAARARRNIWRRYEERVGDAEPAYPGVRIELEPGERVPLKAIVVNGFGTAVSREGELVAVAPGELLDAGMRLSGGPVTVELEGEEAFVPNVRETPPTPTVYDRYLSVLPPASLAYAALTGLLTRSLGRALTALLLVNPRAALIGAESADNGAAARVLRQGVIVVGSREKRPICRPDALIIDSPRVLSDGLEVAGVTSLDEGCEEDEVLRMAAGVAAAAGSPWGDVFRGIEPVGAVDGTFDGRVASAEIDGERWLLAGESKPPRRSSFQLELRQGRRGAPSGRIELQLRTAVGLERLLETCRRYRMPVELLGYCSASAEAIAARLGVRVTHRDALGRIHELQAHGDLVAVLSDSAYAAHAYADCDLAIGLSSGRGGRFAARADLLATDLSSVAAIIEAGARRDDAVRYSVVASALSNVAGGAWGIGGNPRFERGSQATYIAALGAIGASYLRLAGGARSKSVRERLSDPEPERFGRLSIEEALTALKTNAAGLSFQEARARHRPREEDGSRSELARAVLDQLRSPLTGILAGGAAVSLLLGAVGDVAMIGAVIVANTAVGTWQEREAGRAAEALQRMSARTANVVRGGELATIDADGLVPGDVILLAGGDRVPADARLIEADGLEVDEAALTGESVPVAKAAEGGTEASRVVLEGSDVTVGTARALVVAVGRGTRMGATAAAIAIDETSESPLGRRLSEMFRQGLPVIVGGGLLVTVSGLLWGQPLIPQLALGTSIAVAAVPEGLPLLAGVAQAAVARRLAGHDALVRRLAAVEALGRVDVACADKTGTLTEGRLALTSIAGTADGVEPLDDLSEPLRAVLDAAALASPHPDAPDSTSHPTDVAIIEGADRAASAGIRDVQREEERPFEPSRGFHVTRARGRLFVKGAAEVLVPRCERMRRNGREVTLGEEGREQLLQRADALSGQGLRVLMVAEGPGDASIEDPDRLVALGFLGISDPLRPDVSAAIERCEAAGVRVVMLTGDHPATAAAVAREAGVPADEDALLTGGQLGALDEDDLDRRLEQVSVIARITPLDKLRIVEAFQRRGHVVAMTGDGVNDAPALRLADVGVAMGRSGTDVAREAADVVLADDDFSTLVETLVEGRGFWHNIRRALGLLLGGNIGELGLMAAASVAGLPAPLSTRQVLAVNLVTDVLPALAVAVQEPEHRNLSSLSREGTAALDAPLRRSVLRRAAATGAPSFGAYLLASRISSEAQARAVAFTTVVSGQLAQTLDLGRTEGRLSPEVLAAVTGSAAFVAAAVAFGPFQGFLGLALPNASGLILCAAATVSSLGVSRILAASDGLNNKTKETRWQTPQLTA